ncbi:hypothetical protein [Pedobacter cryoconitis]|uniref:Peptidase S74 domain-containing protein n=1 Tax=Pedobacter cryoconitis TaxID=188932 RepID=A0A7X0J428_9SPHI|nr:hypothetical protein [Pedobacter cryoconitis]MBB6499422.1 hypothetical protein [Pedobacter cryoconitis]
MKKTFLILAVTVVSHYSYAQNSVFPIDGRNVGIGTTDPTLALLQVNGSGDLLALYSNTGPAQINAYNNSDFRLIQRNNAPLSFWTNTLERMRIDANGNIGIGTTVPKANFDVNGSGNFSYGLTSSSLTVNGTSATGDASQTNVSAFNNGGVRINGNIANSAQDAISYTSGGGGGAAVGFGRGSSYDTFIAFYTNSGYNLKYGAISEAMRITQAQNVGIGTTTPDAKLTVNGTIHSKAVKVDLNVPAPDYVFDTDYKLISLNELKSYVEKNHHLPEIPSAGQMAKDGLNLGDMNTLLLKKIEELTLYLIEKDGQLAEQQQKTGQQENRLLALEKQLNTLTKALNKN